MAYQARRSSVLTEDIELINKNNEVEKVLHIEFNADRMAREFNTARNGIIRAQKEVNEGKAADAYTAFGKAAIEMFKVVFGEENTLAILEFYENNYVEMVSELMPFITDVAAPAVQQAVDAKKQQLANNYKFSRKERRRLGLW